MTGAVDTAEERAAALPWRWRSADGTFRAPADMRTGHLFYTLRMIWNHCAPLEARVGENIRFYRFGSFYTADYMRQAVRHIWPELRKRGDLMPFQERELDQMREWFGADFMVVDIPGIEAPRKALPSPKGGDRHSRSS